MLTTQTAPALSRQDLERMTILRLGGRKSANHVQQAVILVLRLPACVQAADLFSFLVEILVFACMGMVSDKLTLLHVSLARYKIA